MSQKIVDNYKKEYHRICTDGRYPPSMKAWAKIQLKQAYEEKLDDVPELIYSGGIVLTKDEAIEAGWSD